ncbi:MAG TPA: hypothetical protein VL068_08025 [Microthrixaceae bacterium]|nr:hypothetical protein [Microthrixaceae bacterium]
MAKQRHLRPGEHLADDDIVVVRGGDLDLDALRVDAERYHSFRDPGLEVIEGHGEVPRVPTRGIQAEPGGSQHGRCEHRSWVNPYHED